MIDNVEKNIVLIKNIPSNMIEEAIFILKENASEKMSEVQTEIAKSEAELILQNYIDGEIIKSLKDKTKEMKKNNKMKKIFTINISIITILIILVIKIYS